MLERLKLKLSKVIGGTEDEAKLAANLSFLEDVLKAEDPDFMKSINETTIDNEAVDASLIITSSVIKKPNRIVKFCTAIFARAQSPFWSTAVKPLLVHKYPKQAIAFWLLLVAVIFGGQKLYKAHFWTTPSQLFLTSYADLGLDVKDYDMFEDVEPYYDNVRFSKNIMSLMKMTANIRPSDNSSNNPMISFEIIIQGVSNEPIVEIKDREAEFRDLVLRVTEDFSYDDLDTSEGKQALAESILAKVNANLTEGQVRKVYYKNIVIKP